MNSELRKDKTLFIDEKKERAVVVLKEKSLFVDLGLFANAGFWSMEKCFICRGNYVTH